MTEISSAFVADPELVQKLEKRATPLAIAANRILFRQGGAPSGVYILKKGTILLTSRFNGEEILSVQAGPGSLIGVPAAIGTKPYSLTAKALEGAEISLVTCKDFVNLLEMEPAMSFEVLKLLAEEVRFAREAVSRL